MTVRRLVVLLGLFLIVNCAVANERSVLNGELRIENGESAFAFEGFLFAGKNGVKEHGDEDPLRFLLTFKRHPSSNPFHYTSGVSILDSRFGVPVSLFSETLNFSGGDPPKESFGPTGQFSLLPSTTTHYPLPILHSTTTHSQFSILHSPFPDSPFAFQKDTLPKDTVRRHSPQKAALYSAVLPGLGQVYNKQYWKMPVIYAGGAVAGYLIYYNYSVYNNLRKSFRYRRDDDPTTSLEQFSIWTVTGDLNVNLENFGDGDILQLQQSYRRDLDLSVLLAVGVYALNIVDAVVFAHLYDFDVSEDLTLRLKPELQHVHNGLVNNGVGGFRPVMQAGLIYRF